MICLITKLLRCLAALVIYYTDDFVVIVGVAAGDDDYAKFKVLGRRNVS